MARKLTTQQDKFAVEIAKGETQAGAYRVAYPTSLKWPDSTVYSKASTLAKDGKVRARIKQILEPAMRRLDVSIDRILEERARLALFDIGELALADCKTVADIAKLPEHIRQAVSGWKWDKEGRFTLLIADKNPHLTAMEKHLGMYTEDDRGGGVLNIQINLG